MSMSNLLKVYSWCWRHLIVHTSILFPRILLSFFFWFIGFCILSTLNEYHYYYYYYHHYYYYYYYSIFKAFKERLESNFTPNRFSSVLFLILKSSILAVQLSSELTKRWHLLALAFIWFSLNRFHGEFVDFSELLITLSRLKWRLYAVLSSA